MMRPYVLAARRIDPGERGSIQTVPHERWRLAYVFLDDSCAEHCVMDVFCGTTLLAKDLPGDLFSSKALVEELRRRASSRDEEPRLPIRIEAPWAHAGVALTLHLRNTSGRSIDASAFVWVDTMSEAQP